MSRELNNYRWYDLKRHKKMYSEERVYKSQAGLYKLLKNKSKISQIDFMKYFKSCFYKSVFFNFRGDRKIGIFVPEIILKKKFLYKINIF